MKRLRQFECTLTTWDATVRHPQSITSVVMFAETKRAAILAALGGCPHDKVVSCTAEATGKTENVNPAAPVLLAKRLKGLSFPDTKPGEIYEKFANDIMSYPSFKQALKKLDIPYRKNQKHA